MTTATTTMDVMIASTVAGFTSTLLGHPLDTIKVHLQSSSSASSNSSSSSWHVARSLKWNLFRGMGPPLANAIVMNTVMFSVFDYFNSNDNHNVFVAGLLSGFATAMISTPTDLIKIRAQLHGHSSWKVLQDLTTTTTTRAKQRPHLWLANLYQGHVANLAREGIFTMVYLGFYHYILHNSNDVNNSNHNNSLAMVALTSSLTGAMAWVVSYPMDTIKTLRQGGGRQHDIWHLWNTQGLSKFYHGCATSTGRAMLVTSSRMIAYETCMTVLTSTSSSREAFQ